MTQQITLGIEISRNCEKGTPSLSQGACINGGRGEIHHEESRPHIRTPEGRIGLYPDDEQKNLHQPQVGSLTHVMQSTTSDIVYAVSPSADCWRKQLGTMPKPSKESSTPSQRRPNLELCTIGTTAKG